MVSLMIILTMIAVWLIVKPFVLGEDFPSAIKHDVTHREAIDDLTYDLALKKLSEKEFEALVKGG